METAQRMDKAAQDHRRRIISEYFPQADAARLDIALSPIIFSFVAIQFQEDIRSYLEFGIKTTTEVLDDTYCKWSDMVARQLFENLRDPYADLLSGDASEGLRKIMVIYDEQGRRWTDQVRKWVADQSEIDLLIFKLALMDCDATSIKSQLQLPQTLSAISGQIRALQEDLLNYLVLGLREAPKGEH
jgi:hypothetical protein